jgi:uncharacterized membrane protein
MDDLLKRQKDMYQGLWFGTIVLAILLILFWTVPELKADSSKIKYTIAIVVVIPLAWIWFYRQKKIDEGKIKQKENIGEKAYKGVNIIHGVDFKFRAIKYGIVMLMFLAGGVWILIKEPDYWWIGLMLIVIAIFLPIAIKTFWKVGDQKLKGRYY